MTTTAPAPRTSTPSPSEKKPMVRRRLGRFLAPEFLPIAGTILTFVIMLGVGQARYGGERSFISMKLFSNLLQDNAYLLVLAIGMTFVILTGGSTCRSAPSSPSSASSSRPSCRWASRSRSCS